MGLKIRLGLAFSGLLMSSLFGVNMLTGIKDYVDTTGNIMVDIADGIGMLSKGIEYIEFYLDPDAKTEAPSDAPPDPTVPPSPGDGGGGAASPVDPTATPTPTIIKAGTADIPGTADQPAVICQKGKCYPYDPNRLKNSNLNLEAKPGVILTPQPTAAPTKQNRKYKDDEEEDDFHRKKNYQKKGRPQSR